MKKICIILCNFLHDIFLVTRLISFDEIIVRTLTCPKHISPNVLDFETRKYDNYFQVNRGGVSVNRFRYANENKIKAVSKLNFPPEANESFMGFAVFNMSIFYASLSTYLEKYRKNNIPPDFSAKIFGTPLNEAGEYLSEGKIITRWQKGNKAHADIKYSSQNHAEVPRGMERNFSKILANNSKLYLDKELHNELWTGVKFKKMLK